MSGAIAGAPLFRRLREGLAGSGIAWREQHGDRWSEGSDAVEDLLHLLVRDQDSERFVEVLERLGFKEAYPLSSWMRPDRGHFCGYDERADRIVRLSADFSSGLGNGAGGNGSAPPRTNGAGGAVALAAGGAVIAVVGADGAGKTTALEALCRWLSPHFRVVRIHMGKPRPSWSTVPIKGLLKLAGVLDLLRGRALRTDVVDFAPTRVRRLLWQAVTARDRYRSYLRARRLARRGALVLCDRFPLAEVRTMDGRPGDAAIGASSSRAVRALASLAERYYTAIGRPDFLVVLSVPPDLALRRRIEDPEDRVRRRAEEILAIDWRAADACVLDSGRTLDEIQRELRSWLWKRL